LIVDDSNGMSDRLKQLFNCMEHVEVVGVFHIGIDGLNAI